MFLKFRKVALIITMGVVMWLLPFFNVSASSSSMEPSLIITDAGSPDIAGIKSIVQDCNYICETDKLLTGVLSCTETGTAGNKTVTITFNLSGYNKLDLPKKQKIMETILGAITNNPNLSTATRNRFYTFIANCDDSVSDLVRQLNSDVKADFVGAYSVFKRAVSIIGLALALIAVVLFITLGLSLALDVTYLASPTVQLLLNPRDDSKKKPKLVSHEAYKAIQIAESSEAYINPIWFWLRHRVVIIFLASLCLLYLISGKLFGFIGSFVDVFNEMFGIM